jgi:DNA-3-methyladenine glycosylase
MSLSISANLFGLRDILSKRMILKRSFYKQEVIEVATNLLGKILVHESADGTTEGRIVETEAYMGPEDEAAHSSGGRRTARNEVMYGSKGYAYVYFIYGLYYCLNVTAGDVAGKPEAVLLRALEPIAGEDIMAKRRQSPEGKKANLTNGPSKLCMAMGISKIQNRADMTVPPLYIRDAPVPEEDIVKTTRIGVDYAGAWKDRHWRFYIKDNRFVSRK